MPKYLEVVIPDYIDPNKVTLQDSPFLEWRYVGDRPLTCKPEEATEAEIDRARNEYASNELEIDNGAAVSRADDGIWVAAWVWLREPDEQPKD